MSQCLFLLYEIRPIVCCTMDDVAIASIRLLLLLLLLVLVMMQTTALFESMSEQQDHFRTLQRRQGIMQLIIVRVVFVTAAAAIGGPLLTQVQKDKIIPTSLGTPTRRRGLSRPLKTEC